MDQSEMPSADTNGDIPWWKNKRHQVIGLIVVIVILAAVAGLIIWKQSSHSGVKQDGGTAVEDSQPMEQRLLNGVAVPKGQENLLPVAVMIENLSSIRPQSGLGEAEVVYEALAEGGITRFMVLFSEEFDLDRVGPVRSAREYYVDWAEEYGAAYLHAGGSPGALAQLQGNKNVIDVNQIGGDQKYFYRDPAIGAPHNLFTKGSLLEVIVSEKNKEDGWEEVQGSFRPWLFANENQSATTAITEATTISIPFSSAAYSVRYEYDSGLNQYLRFNGGEPHVAAETGEQLKATTVVVQYVKVQSTNDDKNRIDVNTKDGGKSIAFMNGGVVEGTWEYQSRENRTIFMDASGEEIVFEPGALWIEVVPTDSDVQYSASTATQE